MARGLRSVQSGTIEVSSVEWWIPPVELRGPRIQTTGAPFEKWENYDLFGLKFSTVQVVSDLIRVSQGSLAPVQWVSTWGFPLELGDGDVSRRRVDGKGIPTGSCDPAEIQDLAKRVELGIATAAKARGYGEVTESERLISTVELMVQLQGELNALVISLFPRFREISSGSFRFDPYQDEPLDFYTTPDSLQQAIWFHVAWLGSGQITKHAWRTCLECGTWIFPIDGRQRFCLPYRHKNNSFSRCQQRNSKRRQRSDV